MRKAIVISIFGLISMSLLLWMIKITIDKWNVSETVYDIIRIGACIGWVSISYKVITLKYNWLRKLSGING